MSAARTGQIIRQRLEQLLPEARDADYLDVKTATGRCDLRRFLAGMFSYAPAWVTLLYRLRRVLARVLGLRHADLAEGPVLRPEDVPMAPGGSLKFLTVRAAQEDDFWIGEAGDKHLTGWIVVLVEPLPDGLRRFHAYTVVRFRHWTGPVYFTLIRPFHHLIALGMVRAGVRDVTVE